MLKKHFIALALFACSANALAHHSYKDDYALPAYASPPPVPNTYSMQTFVAGPYLGVSIGPRIVVTRTPTSYTGFEGTLFAGYGIIPAANLYLAGEIFGGNSVNIKTYQNQLTGNYSPRTSWSYGVSALPGFFFNDKVLAYLRLGIESTRFRDVSTSGNTNTNVVGYQGGAGIQINVCNNLDLRTEYIYTQYRNLSTIAIPQSHQANVGLVYNFL